MTLQDMTSAYESAVNDNAGHDDIGQTRTTRLHIFCLA